jgi:hypothetical protein
MLRAITTLTVKRHLLLGGWNTAAATTTTSPRLVRLLSSSTRVTDTGTVNGTANGNTGTANGNTANTGNTGSVKVEQTKSRRRQRQGRLATSPDSSSSIPSYKEFVHRFTVVRMYRNFLKVIRQLPPHNQEDLRTQVQREFAVNKKDANPFNVKRALAEGQRQLAELQDFSGVTDPSDDSWMNTKDELDPRGRVGEGWPWSR